MSVLVPTVYLWVNDRTLRINKRGRTHLVPSGGKRAICGQTSDGLKLTEPRSDDQPCRRCWQLEPDWRRVGWRRA